ncbi:MAG TPA: hypothetical protein ENG74_01645 [Thermoplasmatales archaeon]|nr:hypothetical protein [Thermoplasmatales archaeon]
MKRGKDGIILLHFDEAKLPSKPEDVSRDNIYQQLLYLEKISAEEGVSYAKTILERYENFKPADIERIISLIIKSYSIKQNKKVKFSAKEKREFEILKSLQDMLGKRFVKRGLTRLDDFGVG